MSCAGIDGGIAAAKAGHDVVMSPTSHAYFDFAYAAIDRARLQLRPDSAALNAEEAKHVLAGRPRVTNGSRLRSGPNS